MQTSMMSITTKRIRSKNGITTYDYDEELGDNDEYDIIDQDEIDEIMAEPGQDTQDANPADRIIQQARVAREDTADTAVTDDEDDITVATESSRPTRDRREPDRLTFTQVEESHVTFDDKEWHKLEQCHNLIAGVHPNPDEDRMYTPQMAMVIAQVMTDINSRATIQGASFSQQYIVQHGLKKFGQRGVDAATKEMDQLYRQNCFTPIDVSSMTQEERRKTVEALMFLTEKRDKTIKGRMVYNGKPTREWMSREDSTSPTAALESIMLTASHSGCKGRP